jgi:multidrug efflux pump subunit AcrA (membrane-fusion protein)
MVTAKVVRRDLASSVLATGAVKPQVGAEVRVGARISGKVEHLYANIGDVVKKGQVLAELEKADLEAKVNQRSAELEMAEAKLAAVKSLRPREIEKAEADVAQWQATVELNGKDLARQDELLKQDFTSQQARDRAQEQLAVSQARLASVRKALELAKKGYEEDLRQAAADVARAKAALANDKVQLSYATITAPIDGVIGSVSTQEGETVAAGLSAPTFVTIIDLGRLQVDTFVDEVDIGKIKPGQTGTFTVDSFPSREFAGKVVAIYPKAVIQENVVNYDVVVEITDPYDGLLRPEMTASVTIQLDARENVLAVPVKAVKRERAKSVVYVMSSAGSAQAREVKVGWKDSQWVEIVSGLEEGQTVLLDGPTIEKPIGQ